MRLFFFPNQFELTGVPVHDQAFGLHHTLYRGSEEDCWESILNKLDRRRGVFGTDKNAVAHPDKVRGLTKPEIYAIKASHTEIYGALGNFEYSAPQM